MDKITLLRDQESCSGCGACAMVCPKQAITMTEDETGFRYPVIDHEKCIGCKKCLKICACQQSILWEPQKAYAAVGLQEDVVKSSASGGVFAALAHSVLEQGGLVAGAVMDCTKEGADVYHILSDSKADIARMQGSKYVQSDALRCYRDVCSAVKEGKKVLFSGTPCQVAAIRALTGDPDNLVTAELICHGVPSVKMLNAYLRVLGRHLGGSIESFCFRDKASPKTYTARIQVSRGRESRIYRLRPKHLSFYQHFLEGVNHRESCYSCPFAGMKRVADLTMGDYWGIEKFHSADIQAGTIPNRKDWSCVLINSEKGTAFLETVSDQLLLYPSKFQWIAENNHQLTAPTGKPSERDAVLQIFQKNGYGAVERKFIKDKGGILRFYWRLLRDIAGEDRPG